MRADLQTVLLLIILTISAAAHALEPGEVLAIPLDGFAQSAFPCFVRAPADFVFDQRRIDSVTAIVTQPVFYETNQGRWFVQRLKDTVRNIDVTAFVAGTNVVRRARSSLFQ